MPVGDHAQFNQTGSDSLLPFLEDPIKSVEFSLVKVIWLQPRRPPHRPKQSSQHQLAKLPRGAGRGLRSPPGPCFDVTALQPRRTLREGRGLILCYKHEKTMHGRELYAADLHEARDSGV